MTENEIYERVLRQMLDAGLTAGEAEKIARAQAAEIARMTPHQRRAAS